MLMSSPANLLGLQNLRGTKNGGCLLLCALQDDLALDERTLSSFSFFAETRSGCSWGLLAISEGAHPYGCDLCAPCL